MSAPGPVALTGATGFLGAAIARALRAQGRPVRALTRQPGRLPPDLAAGAVPGNLADAGAIARLLDGAEAVIHCAGLVKALSRRAFFEVNAEAAGRLAQASVHAGVARFTLISSLAARAPAVSDYAASKAAGEAAVRAARPEAVIVRPPAIYGPEDQEMARLFTLARRGLLPCPGDGRGRVSLIHVEDAAEAAVLANDAPVCAGRTYEIDDGAAGGHGWDDLARALSQVLGRPVRLAPTPAWALLALGAAAGVAAALTRRPSVFGPGKAREACLGDWVSREGDLCADAGWAPRIPLNEGLRSTLLKERAAARTPTRLLSMSEVEHR